MISLRFKGYFCESNTSLEITPTIPLMGGIYLKLIIETVSWLKKEYNLE